MSEIRYHISYRIGLGLFDLLKRYQVRQLYRFYQDTLSWSEQKLTDYRNDKLRSLISYAYTHVPFYQKRMQHLNLTPADITEVNDLFKMPPLTRPDLQLGGVSLASNTIDLKTCYKGSSSGSTGEPVIYYHDRACSSAGLAALYFSWAQAGWRFGDRMLTIWGNPTIASVEWNRRSSKVKGILFNEMKYPAYRLTDENRFDEIRTIYEQNNIEVIQGYTNAIYLFAEYIRRKCKPIRRCARVFTTAENLLPYQRSTIEETLGPVYDFYGCGEIKGIAYQSKESELYQVILPHVVVELGNPAGKEGGRELLITDLNNYAYPLIRYQNGDAAVPKISAAMDSGACIDGFSQVLGRISDIIRLPGGGSLTVPSFFGSRLLKELRGFKQYQVERTDPGHLVIHLAVDDNFNDAALMQVKKGLEEYIPETLTWEVNLCEKILPGKNGKFKLLVDHTSPAENTV